MLKYVIFADISFVVCNIRKVAIQTDIDVHDQLRGSGASEAAATASKPSTTICRRVIVSPELHVVVVGIGGLQWTKSDTPGLYLSQYT